MYIQRTIYDKIFQSLFKNKVIIIYGARQVGKTTLINKIKENNKYKAIYLNCDEIDIRQALTNKTSTELKNFIGDNKLVIIDEAQRVQNIGLSLKLLIDNFKDIQVIATGSSSFELSNKISESLTGRKIEFHLYPFSIKELSQNVSNIEIQRNLNAFLVFGMYPDIIVNNNNNNRKNSLLELATSYSYKDVLQFEKIRNSAILERLLQLLALQIGSEVSYTELAGNLCIDKNTVAKYIDILEKAFIIFTLKPFSRNLRNELKKLRKVYFWDVGIRNALINNFNSIDLRQDTGALFENFMIVERIKKNSNEQLFPNYYFWRTQDKKEIDLLEEVDGKIFSYEIKLNKGKAKEPKIFKETYINSSFNTINKNNFTEFL